MSCARVAHDRNRHHANGTGPGNQHVLAEHRERESGVNRIPEWVEDGRDFLIDSGIVTPDIRYGKRNEFRECAGAVHANTKYGGQKRPSPPRAVRAPAAEARSFSAT